MKNKSKAIFISIIFLTSLLNSAFAGISRCHISTPEVLDQRSVLHPSGESEAIIKLTKARYNCDHSDKVQLRVEIEFNKFSDSPLPNHGFISATIQAFAPWGHTVFKKHFKHSAVTTKETPFSRQASNVQVTLEGYGSVELFKGF